MSKLTEDEVVKLADDLGVVSTGLASDPSTFIYHASGDELLAFAAAIEEKLREASEQQIKQLVECVNKLRDTLEDIDSKALAGLCYFTLISAREFHKDIRRACEEALADPLPAAMKGK